MNQPATKAIRGDGPLRQQEPFRALMGLRRGPVKFVLMDGAELTVTILHPGQMIPIMGRRLSSRRKTVMLIY